MSLDIKRMKQWEKLQAIVARDCNGAEAIMSGALAGYKYDVLDETGKLYIECKTRETGLRVELSWIWKLLDDMFHDNNYEIPVIIIAHSDTPEEYIACVHSKVADVGIVLPAYYGGIYNKVERALKIKHKSFRIVSTGHPTYFNVVNIPIPKRGYIDFFIYDRKGFIDIARQIATKGISNE